MSEHAYRFTLDDGRAQTVITNIPGLIVTPPGKQPDDAEHLDVRVARHAVDANRVQPESSDKSVQDQIDNLTKLVHELQTAIEKLTKQR